MEFDARVRARGDLQMPEYLETRADKFTFRVATDRLYTPEGLWVLQEPASRVRIGLTDFMQQRSGDLAFATVKPVGTKLGVGDEFGEIETVKVTQTLGSPVAGAILEANPALDLTPEVVNGDPYGAGWMAVIETASWEKDRLALLDPQAYLTLMGSQIEQELQR